jgi:predicted nucleotidyltransferase
MSAPTTTVKADFLTVHGSRAYGLDRPNSDWDFRGFYIPPWNRILGFIQTPEQYHEKTDSIDAVSWDIRKFFRLAAHANPNVIETLFTPTDLHVIKNPIVEPIFESRKLFLSKLALDSFGGYASSQLYKIKPLDWSQDSTRKDAMHLMRLIDFAGQIFTTGDLNVKVRFPDYLLAIRNGEFTKEQIIKTAQETLPKLDELAEKSNLPNHPDYEELNYLLVTILEQAI